MVEAGSAWAVEGRPTTKRPNLKDVVSDRVRELIFTGQLKPGAKIDQDELAQELGVSRLPVREALIGLESEGLIENIPRRGAFVAPLDRLDVEDHYNIIGMLSGLAAQRAAGTISEEGIRRLEAIQAASEAASTGREHSELNFRFHRQINRAGESRRLRSVISLLAASVPENFFEFTEGWHEVANADHERILEAIRARDGERAREEMERHLRNSAEQAVSVLEARGFWGDSA